MARESALPENVDEIRAAAALEVKKHGLGYVARDAWISTTSLETFLAGGASRPVSLRRLAKWFETLRNTPEGEN